MKEIALYLDLTLNFFAFISDLKKSSCAWRFSFFLVVIVVPTEDAFLTQIFPTFVLTENLSLQGTQLSSSLSALSEVQLDPRRESEDSLEPMVQPWAVYVRDRNSQGRFFMLLGGGFT